MRLAVPQLTGVLPFGGCVCCFEWRCWSSWASAALLSPPVFIYSMPGYSCSIKERMLYSSCKNRLLDEVERDYQLEVTKKVRAGLVPALRIQLCSLLMLCATDGGRQWRRPDGGVSVRGGPPNGAHPETGLLQAPQQARHQGCWRERGGELEPPKETFVRWLFGFLWFMFLRAGTEFIQMCKLWNHWRPSGGGVRGHSQTWWHCRV